MLRPLQHSISASSTPLAPHHSHHHHNHHNSSSPPPPSPTLVSISPLALASILDHHLRRPSDQDRVFGTLLGVREAITPTTTTTSDDGSSFGNSSTTMKSTAKGGNGNGNSNNNAGTRIVIKTAFGVPYQAKKRVVVDDDDNNNLDDLNPEDDEDGQGTRGGGKGMKSSSGGGSGGHEVILDQEHHSAMVEMLAKVNPKEVIVGWYSTHPSLNFFTPLIHNFYVQESSQSLLPSLPSHLLHPQPTTSTSSSKRPPTTQFQSQSTIISAQNLALKWSSAQTIHLTIDVEKLKWNSFVGVPIGGCARKGLGGGGEGVMVAGGSESAAFKPVRNELIMGEMERTGVEFLSLPTTSTPTLPPTLSNLPNTSPHSTRLPPPTTLHHLQTLLLRLSQNLTQISSYVDKIVSGSLPQSQIDDAEGLGRRLWAAVSVDGGGMGELGGWEGEGLRGVGVGVGDGDGEEGKSKGKGESRKDGKGEFNAHLADILMVSYLANLVQTQVEISGRLNLLQ